MHDVTAHGLSMPAIGFGTWQLRGAACQAAVEDALAIGYRHVDTAQLYGNEADVGRALAASGLRRDAVFLTTKIWPSDLAPDDVRRAIDRSLAALGVPFVDLLLIHWPNEGIPLERTLAAFAAVQQAGETRHIGVSNFPSAMLARACALAPVACNQVEYHPFLGQRAVLEVARAHDVAITAYSPVARGLVARDPTIAAIARAHGKTPGQVALRWLIQQPGVAAIPKASAAAHRRENLDLDDFALDDGEMARIGALARKQRLVDPFPSLRWDP